jgi:hypothetical protein
LTPAAASFRIYGRMHDRPKVGDAILFNYTSQTDHPFRSAHADHVAIVVRVFADGNIVSIGGNERTPDGEVARDPQSGAIGYSGAVGSSSYWCNKISGYVSPVEDDMPYSREQIVRFVKAGVHEQLIAVKTRKEIVNLVKEGVAAQLRARQTKGDIQTLVKEGVHAELRTGIGASGVTPARGAEAAVSAKETLTIISRHLDELKGMVQALQQALQPVTPPVTAPAAPPGTAPATPGGADGPAPPAQG